MIPFVLGLMAVLAVAILLATMFAVRDVEDE